VTDEKPIVPEVCDRLNCNLPSCYGWDLCREAREALTNEERQRWVEGLKKLWGLTE
jgi:hypothetical protein